MNVSDISWTYLGKLYKGTSHTGNEASLALDRTRTRVYKSGYETWSLRAEDEAPPHARGMYNLIPRHKLASSPLSPVGMAVHGTVLQDILIEKVLQRRFEWHLFELHNMLQCRDNCRSIEQGMHPPMCAFTRGVRLLKYIPALGCSYLCTGTSYEAQTSTILLILRWAF